ILTATYSCGTVIGFGAVLPCAAALAKASTSGAKSVPPFPKKYSTPRSRKSSRYASPVLSIAIVRLEGLWLRGGIGDPFSPHQRGITQAKHHGGREASKSSK